jgi:hypothetical protein
MFGVETGSNFIGIDTVFFIRLNLPLFNSFQILLILSSNFFCQTFRLVPVLEFTKAIVYFAGDV